MEKRLHATSDGPGLATLTAYVTLERNVYFCECFAALTGWGGVGSRPAGKRHAAGPAPSPCHPPFHWWPHCCPAADAMPYTALHPLMESLLAEPHSFVQSNQVHAKGLPRTDAVIGHVSAMWRGLGRRAVRTCRRRAQAPASAVRAGRTLQLLTVPRCAMQPVALRTACCRSRAGDVVGARVDGHVAGTKPLRAGPHGLA